MKPRHLVTVVLLVFVAASVAYLVFKESKENKPEPSAGEAEAVDDLGRLVTEGGANDSGESGNLVIAYYFLTTKRCPTCRKIESYTAESIETAFAGQLKSGELEFHAVNVDEPENEHYIDDYQLTTKSVVLALYKNGEQVRWKNLELVWEYVGNKQTFMDYIEGETRGFLGEIANE
jgi:hypothetical protein